MKTWDIKKVAEGVLLTIRKEVGKRIEHASYLFNNESEAKAFANSSQS